MRDRVGLLLVASCLITQAAVMAAAFPVPVSPGSATGTAIDGRCPTFAWGAVEGARAYELVVYRAEGDTVKEEPLWRRELPGAALGWTPSLDDCLEWGGRYAWSVRAVGGEAASDWSPPSLFQVGAGPSAAEVAAALETVESYLRLRGGAASPGGYVAGAAAGGMAPGGPSGPAAGPGVAAAAATPRAAAIASGEALQVDGVPVVLHAELCPLYPVFCTKTVFVTSGLYAGDLVTEANTLTDNTGCGGGPCSAAQGLEAGDAICQRLADMAGLAGTYMAWLSDATPRSPATRFMQHAGRYVTVDGTRVADSWSDLTDGTLDAPIWVTETGVVPPVNRFVWTSTNTDGLGLDSSPGAYCRGWTSSATAANATTFQGFLAHADSRWTAEGVIGCAGASRLYCFEQ